MSVRTQVLISIKLCKAVLPYGLRLAGKPIKYGGNSVSLFLDSVDEIVYCVFESKSPLDISCLRAFPADVGGHYPVHAGWEKELRPLINKCQEQLSPALILNYKLVFTGHSKGGTMASIAREVMWLTPIMCVTFGAPFTKRNARDSVWLKYAWDRNFIGKDSSLHFATENDWIARLGSKRKIVLPGKGHSIAAYREALIEYQQS